jgi:serine/threonine-protein kinase
MPANRYPTTQALIDDLTEFLAPRVLMNHNARLVMYLHETGVMTGHQTDEVLSAVAPRVLRRGQRDSGFLWSVAKWQGAALALLLMSGLTVQAAAGRWSGPAEGEAAGAVDVAEAGSLTVSADPWAHVYVDGVHVLTTPSARVIPLRPGKHYVKYTNPYFEPVEHAINIDSGQDLHDRAELTEPAGVGQPAEGAP